MINIRIKIIGKYKKVCLLTIILLLMMLCLFLYIASYTFPIFHRAIDIVSENNDSREKEVIYLEEDHYYLESCGYLFAKYDRHVILTYKKANIEVGIGCMWGNRYISIALHNKDNSTFEMWSLFDLRSDTVFYDYTNTPTGHFSKSLSLSEIDNIDPELAPGRGPYFRETKNVYEYLKSLDYGTTISPVIGIDVNKYNMNWLRMIIPRKLDEFRTRRIFREHDKTLREFHEDARIFSNSLNN